MTEAEQIFIKCMVPHVLAGKSFIQAARAVTEDDERLWLAATEKSDTGAAIRAAIGESVYERIKAS